MDDQFCGRVTVPTAVRMGLRTAGNCDHAALAEQWRDFLRRLLPHLDTNPVREFFATRRRENDVDVDVKKGTFALNLDEFVLGDFPNQVNFEFHVVFNDVFVVVCFRFEIQNGDS